jgi:exodeoxyribonuclease-5
MKCPNAVVSLLNNLKDSEHIHILKGEEEVKQVLENFTNTDKCIAYTNKRVNKINGYMRALRKMPKNISSGDLVVSKSSVCNTDNGFRLCCEDVLTVKYIKQDSRNPGAYLISFLNVPGEFRGFNDVYKYDTECKRIYAECKKKKNFTAYANFSDMYLKLKFSYASTVHSAQGSTYNKVFVDLTDINSCNDIETFIRLIYVAISRAKDEVYIYYGD